MGEREIIRPLDRPIQGEGGLVALFGTLAPNGAILKRAAADAALFERESRAVVFTSLEDLARRVDDPALDVRPRTSSCSRTPARARAGCRRRATCPSRPSSRARA